MPTCNGCGEEIENIVAVARVIVEHVEKHKEVQEQIYDLFHTVSDDVERVSLAVALLQLVGLDAECPPDVLMSQLEALLHFQPNTATVEMMRLASHPQAKA